MKICITAQGEDLEANVDPRFGRCQGFIIVDVDTLEFEVVKNPNMDSSGGNADFTTQVLRDVVGPATSAVSAIIRKTVGGAVCRLTDQLGAGSTDNGLDFTGDIDVTVMNTYICDITRTINIKITTG